LKDSSQYLDYFLNRFDSHYHYFFKEVLNPGWGNNFYLVVGLIFIFFILERIFPWREKQKINRKGLGVDIFYTAFNYIIIWFFGGYALCDLAALLFHDAVNSTFGFVNFKLSNIGTLPNWLQLIFMFLYIDFLSYLGHVLMHKIPFLWKLHKVHHAAEELDVFNAGKGHIIENFVYTLIGYIPLAIIGFNVADSFIVFLIIYTFSIFTHCNINIPLGPLKYIFNNPQMHIWHHDKGIRGKTGVNFGDALSIWDFFFTTAYLSEKNDGKNLELGFKGYKKYPKGFLMQQVQPFIELLKRP